MSHEAEKKLEIMQAEGTDCTGAGGDKGSQVAVSCPRELHGGLFFSPERLERQITSDQDGARSGVRSDILFVL